MSTNNRWRMFSVLAMLALLALVLVTAVHLEGTAANAAPPARPLELTTTTFNNAAAITGTAYSTWFLSQSYSKADLYAKVVGAGVVTVTVQHSPDNVTFYNDTTLVLNGVDNSNYATGGFTYTTYLPGRYTRVMMVADTPGMTPTIKAVFR